MGLIPKPQFEKDGRSGGIVTPGATLDVNGGYVMV